MSLLRAEEEGGEWTRIKIRHLEGSSLGYTTLSLHHASMTATPTAAATAATASTVTISFHLGEIRKEVASFSPTYLGNIEIKKVKLPPFLQTDPQRNVSAPSIWRPPLDDRSSVLIRVRNGEFHPPLVTPWMARREEGDKVLPAESGRGHCQVSLLLVRENVGKYTLSFPTKN